jgi:hypothetical protein
MHAGGKIGTAGCALALLLLSGCATMRQAAGPPAPSDNDAVSVRLPVITPLKIAPPPTTPPGSQPSITPTDIQEGKERSLKMIEIDYTLGKPGPPVPDNTEIPSDNTETEEGR